MGEEVKMTEYEAVGGDEERIAEWELGLPNVDDLTPLAQPLIPPELASAFSISPEPNRTLHDVNKASQNTLENLRGGLNALPLNNFKSYTEDRTPDAMVVEAEAEMEAAEENMDRDRKLRKLDSEEADSALRTENSIGGGGAGGDDPSARTLKRPRLVWTPQLHKRFVDVVAYLGIKNAVPKTIMQLMNVEGLTRENVASHLQKYRLYLKRMQGLPSDGPSSSDQLFSSTPVPQSLHESGAVAGGGGGGSGGGGSGSAHGIGHLGMPLPLPYHPGAGPMMPVPVYGHMGMQSGSNDHHLHQQQQLNHHHHHSGFDGNAPYNMLQQRDWSANNYGSVVSYPHHPHHVAPPNENM